MNYIAACILASLISVVLFAPRRWALMGMIAGVLYLTQWHPFDVLGFHMYLVRFLEIAGFARVMARKELSLSDLNEVDRALIILYLFTTIVFLLRSDIEQSSQIGLAVDAFLCYFTFRGLAGGIEDLRWFLCALLILLAPYLVLLLIESRTGHNPFANLSAGWSPVDSLRGDRVRCIGSFREPSLLGSLGASFLPLYIGLTFSKSSRSYAVAGILLCLGIVWCSNSGAPAAFAGIGVLGWILWRFREKMRLMRRVAVIMIAALIVVMKAPIWYLPTKIVFLTGGDGWHRSYLMDVAFRHFGEWWLWGMSLSKTSHWFPYSLALNGDADITNQFISLGLTAGFVGIVLFISLLVRAFQNLGKKLAEARLALPQPCEREYLLWGLGVMLAGHIANLATITYFDQFYVIWFMQLAFISNLTSAHEDDPMPSVSMVTPVSRWRWNDAAFNRRDQV